MLFYSGSVSFLRTVHLWWGVAVPLLELVRQPVCLSATDSLLLVS